MHGSSVEENSANSRLGGEVVGLSENNLHIIQLDEMFVRILMIVRLNTEDLV